MSAKGFTLNTTKKQGVIRVLDLGMGLKAVDYRGTQVVRELSYKAIQLNTNGWLTVTSKRAINRYFDLRRLPMRLVQEKFVWYVYLNGKKLQYDDNMVIDLGLCA